MSMTVAEAGRRGGLKTSRTRGKEFYQKIGLKGQKTMRRKYPDMARFWGKLGGRPKKPTLAEIMGEYEEKNKEEENAGSPSILLDSPARNE